MTLYDPRTLLARQEGFRWADGKRDALRADWDQHWLVIGDHHGDPVIAQTDQVGTPVVLIKRGQNSWKPYLVAPSLVAYIRALAAWIETSAVDFRGDIRGDDGLLRPAFRADLVARLTPILSEEYRRHWLDLAE